MTVAALGQCCCCKEGGWETAAGFFVSDGMPRSHMLACLKVWVVVMGGALHCQPAAAHR